MDNKDRLIINRGGFDFVWHFGEYIEVAVEGCEPSDVINVWDSARGMPRIERSYEAMSRKVDEYLKAVEDAEDEA